MTDGNGTKDKSSMHENTLLSTDHHSMMGIDVGGGSEENHNHSSSNGQFIFKWSEPRYVSSCMINNVDNIDCSSYTLCLLIYKTKVPHCIMIQVKTITKKEILSIQKIFV